MKLSQSWKDRIMIFLATLGVAAFLYFLTVPLNYILIGFSGFYVILFLWSFVKEKSHVDDNAKCWNYAKKWWYNLRKETLSTDNGRGYMRIFGEDKFYAYIVNRGDLSGTKSYLPIVLVVKANGPELVDWDDNPRPEKLENPFIDISPKFTGAPSPTIKPELEPILRFRPRIKEEKKEEEKKEVIAEEEE